MVICIFQIDISRKEREICLQKINYYVPVHLLLLLPVENDASSDPNEAFISTKNDNGANRLALNLLPPLFPNHRTVDSIDF